MTEDKIMEGIESIMYKSRCSKFEPLNCNDCLKNARKIVKLIKEN